MTHATHTEDLRLIKRYANRKLYDTNSSCYVTLDEIAEMIRAGEELQIIDNRTKDDLTNVTLAQIIFEQQKSRSYAMSLGALRSLIQNSGDFLQRLGQPVSQLRDEAAQAINRLHRRGAVEDEAGDVEGASALKANEGEGRERSEDLRGLKQTLDEHQARIEGQLREALSVLPRDLEGVLQRATQRIEALEAQVAELTSALRERRSDDERS